MDPVIAIAPTQNKTEEFKNEIDKFMMKYDYDYEVKIFSGYSEEFYNFAKTNRDFKVYLLDIKTPEGSGLDAARIIREEYEEFSDFYTEGKTGSDKFNADTKCIKRDGE